MLRSLRQTMRVCSVYTVCVYKWRLSPGSNVSDDDGKEGDEIRDREKE